MLHGLDNMQGKQNTGRVAAVPNMLTSLPNVVTSVPNAVAPMPNQGTPVKNFIPSVTALLTPVTNAAAVTVPGTGTSSPDVIGAVQNSMTATDADFISHTTNFILFTNTSVADPDDGFVATVFQGPFFTDILTSGADPSDSLGFGAAGTGVAGETVNTLETPLFSFVVALPVTDPFAGLFTALIPLGF